MHICVDNSTLFTKLAIGNALRPLTQLTDLHLGFFVSPESVFDEHITHCAVDAQPPGPEWCPTCFAAHAGPVRAAELATTMVLVQKLPKVERVTWASFFARRHQESRTTVVWVQRSEGRIRVRRKNIKNRGNMFVLIGNGFSEEADMDFVQNLKRL